MTDDTRPPYGLPVPAPEDGDIYFDRGSGRVYVGVRGEWSLSKMRNVFREGQNQAVVETRLREDGTMEISITREHGIIHVVADGAVA